MTKPTNKDKNIPLDESILDEVPPDINEPQTVDDKPENQDPNPDPVKPPAIEPKPSEPIPSEEPPEEPAIPEEPEPPQETLEQKEQRYKAQQTEAQIISARNKALTDKVDQAANLSEPTEEELKAFVRQDGVEWDELTTFEKSMAKKTLISNRRFEIVNEAVQTTKKIDEWATKVDTFIDSTDGKPEFVGLSGHEADFRRFCMKETHRGSPIDTLLLPAFLQNLPKPKKVRGNLFETGGGGVKPEEPSKITDADTVANLRTTNPREYKRQLKAGKINLEI